MNNDTTNGQGTENVSSTEGKTATPSVDSSNSQTSSSTEKKVDVKQPESENKVPYGRFSEVVAAKSKLEVEVKQLREQISNQKGDVTDKQINKINELSDEAKKLFGEGNAEEGMKLMSTILTKEVERKLSEERAKDKKERDDASAKQTANLEYVEKETTRVSKEFEITDINGFKKFIEDDFKKKGYGYWNKENNLDFDTYAELYKARNQPKVVESKKDFAKVAGKTTNKTSAEKVFTPSDVRHY